MPIEIKNAIIEDVRMTTADHGCLSIWLTLNYGGSGQGFGGYALYLPPTWKHHDRKNGYAGHFIWRCMEIAGVDDWSKMVGKTIRVKADCSKVHAIGHIVTDDWFEPSLDFAQA